MLFRSGCIYPLLMPLQRRRVKITSGRLNHDFCCQTKPNRNKTAETNRTLYQTFAEFSELFFGHIFSIFQWKTKIILKVKSKARQILLKKQNPGCNFVSGKKIHLPLLFLIIAQQSWGVNALKFNFLHKFNFLVR